MNSYQLCVRFIAEEINSELEQSEVLISKTEEEENVMKKC
jgi:hypothetical protein